MSLAEVMTPYRDEAPRTPDRTPPQDMDAEQCVLGAMMMSKDAIADVVEALRGHDFYRPAHEQVYDAVVDLYGRGEPADAITVAAELGKRGELVRLGGAPYLHTLLSAVPVAANAGYYAEIVREKAILQRLVDASIKIGQLSYAGEGDVDAIVDRAQAEVYAVTDRKAAEDYKPLSELMQPTNRKPVLSDLRESGSLEQDADTVVLLNRPDIHDKESDRAGEADIDVAKHRNGPTKTITVAFQGQYSRFTDMAQLLGRP